MTSSVFYSADSERLVGEVIVDGAFAEGAPELLSCRLHIPFCNVNKENDKNEMMSSNTDLLVVK